MSKSILYRSFVTAIIVLLFISSIAFLYVKGQEEDTWLNLASMKEARYGLGVVEENGKIYAMGGYPGSGPATDINEEYDPQTDKWTTKASMPEPMYDFGITVYTGKIYCFSGETGSTYAYTPLYDTWETKTPLPNPRQGITANTLNDRIYIIGGNTKIMNVYDPSNDSWNTKAPILYNFGGYTQGCSSVVFNDKIHVFGATPREFSHQIYDPTTDSWSLGEPLIDRYYFSIACATTGVNASKQIYVFGTDRDLWGLDTPALTSQSYNPKIGNWNRVSVIPSGHLNGGAANIDDKLYVIGGAGAGYSNVIFANSLSRLYIPIGYGKTDASYIPATPSPTPTIEPTPTPDNQQTLNTETIIGTAIIIAVLGTGIGLLMYLLKRH